MLKQSEATRSCRFRKKFAEAAQGRTFFAVPVMHAENIRPLLRHGHGNFHKRALGNIPLHGKTRQKGNTARLRTMSLPTRSKSRKLASRRRTGKVTADMEPLPSDCFLPQQRPCITLRLRISMAAPPVSRKSVSPSLTPGRDFPQAGECTAAFRRSPTRRGPWMTVPEIAVRCPRFRENRPGFRSQGRFIKNVPVPYPCSSLFRSLFFPYGQGCGKTRPCSGGPACGKATKGMSGGTKKRPAAWAFPHFAPCLRAPRLQGEVSCTFCPPFWPLPSSPPSPPAPTTFLP